MNAGIRHDDERGKWRSDWAEGEGTPRKRRKRERGEGKYTHVHARSLFN